MRGIVGRIKIDGDQPGAMMQSPGVALDHALGQRRAHAIKLARANAIFKARQRRLGSHIETRDRIAVQQHLVHRIGSQTRRVVGVRIAAADGEDALRKKIPQRMVHLARLPRIAQNSLPSWRSIRNAARLPSTARRRHRNCLAAGQTPTQPAWPKSLETTNALSR